MTCGIYEIVHMESGKRYVGSSVDIERRWQAHQLELRKGTHHAQHLQRSWNKYGGDKFTMRVIIECGREDLIKNEQAELDKGYDYNSSPTAGNTLGLKFSDEARERVRASRRRMLEEDPEGFKAGMSAISKKKVFTDEVRRRMSESLTGVPKSKEHVSKMRSSRSPLSEETVVSILIDRRDGMTLSDIMDKHSVSHKQAQSICSGERYGWMHDGSLLIGKSESINRRIDQTRKQHNHTIYHYIHPSHGERSCTQWELKDEFPELLSSKVSQLSSGKRHIHKGWTLKKAP